MTASFQMKYPIILALVLMTVGLASAQTEVDGEVSGVWTFENSPYIVLEGANIPSNQTLTVQTGVEVIMRHELIVHGAIHAEGAEGDSVVIRDDPDVEVVNYLLFYHDHDGDASIFEHTILSNNEGHLIYIVGGCDDLVLNFTHSRFAGSAGIRTSHGAERIRIENCLIDRDPNCLLQLDNVRHIIIEDNDIFWLRTLLSGGLEFILRNNRFIDNPRIQLIGCRDVVISGNRTEPPDDLDNDLGEDLNENVIEWLNDSPRRDPNRASNVEFINNSFMSSWHFSGINEGECLIQDDTLYRGGLFVGGFQETIIANCVLAGPMYVSGSEDDDPFVVEDNIISNNDEHSSSLTIRGENFSPIVRNNFFPDAYLTVERGATPDVHNNEFGSMAQIRDACPNIHHNVFGASSSQYREGAGGAFVNNIVLAWDDEGGEFEIRDGSDPLISSNIFYHNWDVAATAIRCYGEPRATIRYNIFYQFEENFRDIEPEDNNLFVDPLFAHVNPFDFRLQPHSPAIDAGDPDLPEDPDGTRCDIGLIFFDQRGNNRPCITSPAIILIGYGDTLTYVATATDESEELSFRFEDLPEWLDERERRDFVEDTAVVSGVVPEDEPSFRFTVYCEDDEGEEDSLVVDVEVSTYTLLRGSISGVLSVEDSPFWIPEPVQIESGDSLFIEPGCVISSGNPPWQPRPSSSFYVYGYLRCVGTEEDTIYFIGYNNHDIKMPRFFTSTDTSEIGFTQCGSNLNGAHILSYGGRIIVHNCIFSPETMVGVCPYDSSWVRVSDNLFFNVKPGGGRNSDIELIDNIAFCDSSIERMPYSSFRECNTISIGNLYRNYSGTYWIRDGGTLMSRNDIFLNCSGGFSLDAENAVVENCFLSETDSPSLRLYNGRITIRNSIILSDSNRILDDIVEEVEMTIENNLFLSSDTLVEQILEGFGILSELNANEDSTDAYGNIFGNPGLINIYPLEYRLGRNSRCINAALTDDDERDPDGTRPDIGPIPFNHDNHPIEISGSYLVPELRIYAREEIHCGVEIVDPDDDSTAFKWDLYRSIPQPDMEPPIRIFLRTIGRSADIIFSVDTTGNYSIRCLATDGYDLDTLYREIFALPSSVEDDYVVSPTEFHLYQNYPNPFNSSTTISFDLPNLTHLRMEVYDLQGRKVVELSDREYSAGYHHLIWKATNLPSGVYICRFQSPVKTGNILITKIK